MRKLEFQNYRHKRGVLRDTNAESEFVNQSFRKLFKWSRITGFFPFVLTPTTIEFDNSRYTTSIILTITLLVQVILTGQIFVSLNPMDIFIVGFPSLAFLSVILLTLVANVHQFKDIKNALRHMRKSMLIQGGCCVFTVRSSKSKILNYSYLCVGIAEFFANAILHEAKPHLASKFRLLPLFFVSMSILNQFYGLLQLLQSCLVNLNKSLRAAQPVRANKKLLTNLSDGYDCVVFAANAIGDFYSFRTLVMIMALFINSTVCTFVAWGTDKWGTRFMNINWCVVSILPIYSLVRMCSSLTDSADEFIRLLYTKLIQSDSEEILEEKAFQLHICSRKALHFSAFGFFNLEYPMLHSMAAATVTYVINLGPYIEANIANVNGSSYQGNTTTRQ